MALLGVLGLVAGLALAANGPNAPRITSGPPTFTTSTSANFAFNDSPASVTFVCSLDGSTYAACTSPKAYSGLAGGAHTFRVEAVSGAQTSTPAAYSWTIVVAPPSIAITFPANGGSYNGSRWSAGCSSGAGVCGTASDPSGVTSVLVSIKQNATGKYWNGSSYSSAVEAYQSARLTTSSGGANWFYGLRLPAPDGQYTLHVRATNGVGLHTPSGSPATSVFSIDTKAPPAPSLTSSPASLTNQTSASFGFTDAEAGVSYVCRLDGGSFTSCASPKSYSGLAQGNHTFFVEAVDQAGNVSVATSFTWVINTVPPGIPTITGNPTNPTTATAATFTFTEPDPDNDGDNDRGINDDGGPSKSRITFQCQLDGAAWQPCVSPTIYSNLSTGTHTFKVEAVDAAGNVSSPASFTWTIQQTTGIPFTISGDAVGLLYPGASPQALAVKLTNPNNVDIFVTSLTATVQPTGLPAGCTTGNFKIVPSSIASAGVDVPANGSVTLPTQGATAPTLQMIDTNTNQDACQRATVSVSYTGSAHS